MLHYSVFLIVAALYAGVYPCSSFLLTSDSSLYVGKNYDWNVESGRIIVNKRNVKKVAFGVGRPVGWMSKYGSITFNQYGQDFPCGGMNEKGLVIEALWLNETTYPKPADSLKTIDNMQWIQYQLDNAACIDDVIKNNTLIAINPVAATAVHCFIADRGGSTMIFEYINQTRHHYCPHGKQIPALTNDPYEKSLRMLGKCSAFGGDLKVPSGKGSITRFIRVGIELQNYSSSRANGIEYSFDILGKVSLGGYTKWSIVYDIGNLTIYYKTKSGKKVKSIPLSAFNMECSSELKSINIVNKLKGNITSNFKHFTVEQNKKAIVQSFKKTPFLKNVPSDFITALSRYPQEFECTK